MSFVGALSVIGGLGVISVAGALGFLGGGLGVLCIVVGVLSGNRNTVPFASVQGNFNVAVRLSAPNFILVCHWLGKENTCRDRYKDFLDEDIQDTLCKS